MRDGRRAPDGVRAEKIREFWNRRAPLGFLSGTNDWVLKQIEMDLILKKISGGRVLDVGCGTGETLIELARNKGCSGLGVDFAENMVQEARLNSEKAGCDQETLFEVGQVPGLPVDLGLFDYAVSERCLINLPDGETQHRAFLEIVSHIKRGGCFLMLECSQDGLDRLNELRAHVELEGIAPPWHNVFLAEEEVLRWQTAECVLEEFLPYSSTYYFLSRVIYARLARDKGEELRYDSDINMLAPRLPTIGDVGAARLWLWRRRA